MDLVKLTQDMVAFNSSTALSNAPVSDYIRKQLRKIGFRTELVTYDDRGVKKVSVVGRKGKGKGGLALLCHSDTVPADDWAGPGGPFKGTVVNGRIYGRGSDDMKGQIACALCAAERFNASVLGQPITVVVTSDEETTCGGAKAVVAGSDLFREAGIRYGVITEPTRLQVVHAHKGAMRFVATAKGKAAHSSTGKGLNAHLKMIPFLHEMWLMYHEITTDKRHFNTAFDPPFSDWNITINDGNTAANVTVPLSRATINYRAMPGQDVDGILRRVMASARNHGVHIAPMKVGKPFLTPLDSRIVKEALSVTRQPRARTVSYGTDGMVYGGVLESVVLGPGDIKQAHTHDEWVSLDQLRRGVDVYAKLIQRFCARGEG